MTNAASADYALQHLIDPEVCIRCNTCESTCPIGAVTHDARNYVVDFAKCNACNACIPPCPTGAIDHWQTVRKSAAYTLDDQFGWDSLPMPIDWPSSTGNAVLPKSSTMCRMSADASSVVSR